MDSLDNTAWDVLIVGTGLQQSLLALALSRSGKKILHVDENPYYGGAEAVFNLQEAEDWVKKTNGGSFGAAFAKASIHKPELSDSDSTPPWLRPGRTYNVALGPEIIYSRSAFMQYLIKSQAAHQVEFVPVGSWWVYSPEVASGSVSTKAATKGSLAKVPSKREDLFNNDSLGFPAKRKLVKVLRFILDHEKEDERAKWEEYRNIPFSAFLSAVFKTPADLLAPIFALLMSSRSPEDITTEYALPRLARHMRSFGAFGGFSAIIPKYGGLEEISQVACRACAVGGGVYALGTGPSTSDGAVSVVQVAVESPPELEEKSAGEVQTAAEGQLIPEPQTTVADMSPRKEEPGLPSTSAAEKKSIDEKQEALDEKPDEGQPSKDEHFGQGPALIDDPPTSEASMPAEQQAEVKRQEFVSHAKLHLQSGEAVTAQWIVCETSAPYAEESVCKSITIVSSPLQTLFPQIDDKTALPASAVLVFPTGSLSLSDRPNHQQNLPPVHIQAHSADSGECPTGQSVLYASTTLSGDDGFQLLKQAMSSFLTSVDVSPSPIVLWSMQYEQRSAPTTRPLSLSHGASAHVLTFSPVKLDLAVDDTILDRVREIWEQVTDEDPADFLAFEAREAPVG